MLLRAYRVCCPRLVSLFCKCEGQSCCVTNTPHISSCCAAGKYAPSSLSITPQQATSIHINCGLCHTRRRTFSISAFAPFRMPAGSRNLLAAAVAVVSGTELISAQRARTIQRKQMSLINIVLSPLSNYR